MGFKSGNGRGSSTGSSVDCVHDAVGSPSLSTKPPGTDVASSGIAFSVGGGNTSGPTLALDAVPAYSPTQTETFLTCPMLWWYGHKQGWQMQGGWTPNRLIGNAVDAGMKALWRGESLPKAQDWAAATVCREYVEQDTWSLDDLYARATLGVLLGSKSPHLNGMEIVAVEPSLNGRKPDVVLRSSEGLVVDDLKVSLSLDARSQEWRFEEYTHKWQFRDYAYHVQEEFKEPVVQVRVVQVVLSPRRHVPIHSIPMTQTLLDQWHRSAEQVWLLMHRMEQGLLHPWMNLRACTDTRQHFGKRCDMYEACHVFGGDTEQFSVLYQQKER